VCLHLFLGGSDDSCFYGHTKNYLYSHIYIYTALVWYPPSFCWLIQICCFVQLLICVLLGRIDDKSFTFFDENYLWLFFLLLFFNCCWCFWCFKISLFVFLNFTVNIILYPFFIKIFFVSYFLQTFLKKDFNFTLGLNC